MAVQDSPQAVADREALVQDGEEDLTQLSGHRGAVWRVVPDDVSASLPPRLGRSGCWSVAQLLLVPCSSQSLLVWPLGSFENCLVGGEV